MKTNKIRIIILLTAISLLGLVFTQSFWIYRGIRIEQKHFEHRVHGALNNTVDEIKQYNGELVCKTKWLLKKKKKERNNTCYIDTTILHVDSLKSENEAILFLVNPNMVDSLLSKYLRFAHVDDKYEFAIKKSKNDSIVYATKGFLTNINEEHIFRHCLTCVYNKQSYHLAVILPGNQKYMMSEIWGWFTLSVVFVIIIVICFGIVVIAANRHKKLSEMKTDFINNMTHEFKTPISTISLSSEVLLDCTPKTDSERVKRYAKIIYDENQRMRMQVEQVLRMSRFDKGEVELTKEEVDVHELITTAVNNLCLEESEKQVALSYNFTAEQPLIQADMLYLTSIITNLVDNAYKYSSDKPEIELTTANTHEGIVISVIDNGIGINPDKHKYIFEKFYRVPTGNIHDVKGFGIGLYYVKEIVEAHGGTITVKSEVGNGSRFDVFLPFK